MSQSPRPRSASGGQLSLFPSPCRSPLAQEATRPYAITIYKVALVRESTVQALSATIRTSQDAVAIIRAHLAGVDREHFVALLLNRKHWVIGLNTVSIGSLTASIVSPREVFKPAIVSNAAAILCAHNHPSGDPQPSAEDRALTLRLVEAGKLLGIEVLDHVIVGDGTTAAYSFADQGALA